MSKTDYSIRLADGREVELKEARFDLRKLISVLSRRWYDGDVSISFEELRGVLEDCRA